MTYEYQLLCTIHDVRFGCSPPAEASEEVKKFSRIPLCPVCSWLERNQMQGDLYRAQERVKLLLAAIEIKQEALRVEQVAMSPAQREIQMLRECNAQLVATEQVVRAEKNRLEAVVRKLTTDGHE